MNNEYFINKETFENLEDSTQRWMIVKYDKSIKLGNHIRLIEVQNNEPSNRNLVRKIIHIYRGEELKDGYAILTLKNL